MILKSHTDHMEKTFFRLVLLVCLDVAHGKLSGCPAAGLPSPRHAERTVTCPPQDLGTGREQGVQIPHLGVALGGAQSLRTVISFTALTPQGHLASGVRVHGEANLLAARVSEE